MERKEPEDKKPPEPVPGTSKDLDVIKLEEKDGEIFFFYM